jgi:hypothetical protein
LDFDRRFSCQELARDAIMVALLRNSDCLCE